MMIYYFGYFDFQDSKVQRKYIVSATNKMEYIARAVQSIGYPIEFVSLSLSNKRGIGFHKTQVRESNGLKARFFPTCDMPLYWKWLKDLWRNVCVLLWGLRHLNSDDVVISYHTTSKTSSILVWLRKVKKFRIILEVEEIYSDVAGIPKHALRREYNTFENCDAYIFSTELLEEKLNTSHKPYVVIYGTYNVEKIINKPGVGDIHVVYAGTFDKRKGGAAAAAAAAYLPQNYVMHICGFGKPNEVEEMTRVIRELQSKGYKIKYEGLLKGSDYISLLQSCSIGLSTQDPSAKFNNTSFPSKILSYMSNGLSVVSIRIDAVLRSKIGNSIYYYDVQTPQNIADSILSVDVQQAINSRNLITSLDEYFKKELATLIEDVNKR